MEASAQISEFGKIFIFLIVGILFVVTGYLVNKFLRRDKPNSEKLAAYECGEEPIGTAHIQFNNRFYVIALVFLLFEVEIVFLFPWATVFADKQLITAAPSWGWLSLVEMGIFIGILLLGLVYVWVKGDLNWIKPQPIMPMVPQIIPQSIYQSTNQTKYTAKAFTLTEVKEETAAPVTTAVNKPLFKPGMAK